MDLEKYFKKKVKIVDNIGRSYIGIINDYIYPDENEDGLESIVMDTPQLRYSEEFNEKRIKSIEVI